MLITTQLSKRFYATLALSCVFLIVTNILVKGSFINLLAGLSGVLYAFFAGERQTICFVFGLVYNLSYAYVAYQWKLNADVILCLFLYMPVTIYGLFAWKKTEQHEGVIKAQKLPKNWRFILILGIGVLTYASALFFKEIKTNFLWAESFNFVIFIIAFILQVLRYMESYALMTLGNIVSIIVWFCIFQISTESLVQLFTTILYLFIGMYYFNRWNKSCKQ
ncbi:nicotinamide riboside transporter PnuC [Helicobacter pylori]|uniref:nicotinamide riboside transporter PnuC n=1 Tax=Helicobacter pylori TaxID=210 RepID=UPI0012E83A64|nr:nicotinamide riboside transporter PnuC [Helicobacter pylori]MUU55617.1 nicotinamide riboside transporter PnuC [Helicobacter pylori]WQV77317.1 nicotinamide riboside transporter PnuC [Helicobacter pylori]